MQQNCPPYQLRRALTLRDLGFYGIICIQPTAPMPLFGVVSQEAKGHVVTTVLIEFGAWPGFLAGWSIMLDYLLNPLICTIWCSSAAANLIPGIPTALWKVFFALLFTMLNLRGIEAAARTNEWLAIAMGGVVVIALLYFGRYIFLEGPHDVPFFTRPFYDPATFSLASVSTGASIAALTYIGFDSISTLSEEAINPRREYCALRG